MPNWITNKVQAPTHVIQAILNTKGQVDFNLIAPFTGLNDWDGINLNAEMIAKMACGIPVHSHPLIGALEAENRSRCDLRKISEESYQQLLGMLENYRTSGFLHRMEFARVAWGTKWNACRSTANADAGECVFETANNCPKSALVKLSERFAQNLIIVTYADEDIGSNCGTFTLLGGQVISQDIAPNWNEMDETQQSKWRAFACQVTGREIEQEERGED